MSARKEANGGDSLAGFACPNGDCDRFNQFNAGNLSVVERMGKDKAIRRLRCNVCGHRSSPPIPPRQPAAVSTVADL